MTQVEQLKYVNIEDISPNPYQPRITFDQEELEELAHSIAQNGLIQPIIVRQSEIFGYELIAGERRLKASKIAGLKTIPVIVKEINDSDSMHQAIVENLQRSNLNPIEEALAYQQLITNQGLTHEDIAKYMGKSRPYITNSLRLLNLPEPIQAALQKNQLSPGHARILLGLKHADEQLRWFDKILSTHMSVRQLETATKHLNKKKTPSIPKKDIFVKETEDIISQALGVPVHITATSSDSGKISITFNNIDELNRIIHSLK